MKINIGDRIQLTRDVFRCKAGSLGRFRDDRERIWFSPHCLRPELETQMSLGF